MTGLTPSTKRLAVMGIIVLGAGALWFKQTEIASACVTGLILILREEVSRSVKWDKANGDSNV
uniref:Uncharacterized protein n=1 Tax=viral metagenome TaxID=1070528 RepID=A0A6M3LQ90_9ZZZZ